ncbi:hypothetical protein Q5427_10890 [Brochothrix thermosphacta]|uniref:hypothetical protein n=1 Tax=Brochothrix thermosphacta TaxID=2756 RepID=UPI00271284F4|nr:hypothetical protein [Brochothrix thermosphacta]MDO7864794.1 hypothetical protein [Brochothrix thermosphacta]
MVYINKPLNEVEIQKAIEIYESGLSLQKTAEAMGYKKGERIGRWFKSVGYTCRDHKNKNTKQGICNFNYFESINTAEKAYWLGFIAADGYILNARKHSSMKVGISLSTKDRCHLEKFLVAIDAKNVSIGDYKTTSGYKIGTPYSRVMITGDDFANSLIEKGIVKNKSLILKFPTHKQVPREFIYHYLRGFVDGDGSIMIKNMKNNYKMFQVYIGGTKEFLMGMQDLVGNSNKLEKRWDNGTNHYGLKISGVAGVKFAENIYKESTIHINRKKEKFEEYKLLSGG